MGGGGGGALLGTGYRVKGTGYGVGITAHTFSSPRYPRAVGMTTENEIGSSTQKMTCFRL